MARQARKKSNSGVYHVLLRACAGLELFADEEDTSVYQKLIRDQIESGGCMIYAFSLHKTHAHLLLKEGTDPVGMSVKRLAAHYSYFFNVKYDHYGPIYQDRYKSEPVETKRFFLRVEEHIMAHSAMMKEQIANVIPPLPDDNSQDGQIVIEFKPRPLRITDSRLLEYLSNEWNYTTPEEFQGRSHDSQTEVIIAAKKIGASIRQLQRFTHIAYDRIFSAK